MRGTSTRRSSSTASRPSGLQRRQRRRLLRPMSLERAAAAAAAAFAAKRLHRSRSRGESVVASVTVWNCPGSCSRVPSGPRLYKSTKEQTRCKIGATLYAQNPCRLLLRFHPPLFSSDLPQPVGARRHARPLQVLVFRGRGCAILEILKLVKILEFLESLVVPYTLHAFRDLRS